MQHPAGPDPVSDPKAYQDLLIGLVGTDDPAAIQTFTLTAGHDRFHLDQARRALEVIRSA